LLPCGRQRTHPRSDLSTDIAAVARALSTAAEIVNTAGLDLLVDLSHVVASGGHEADAVRRFGDRIRHVHMRDAVLGGINRSIGRGQVDFPAAISALAAAGYRGHYSLEFETHDIDDVDRPAEAGRAGRYISELLRP
jgi:sugar phosphate isomerase/epimerase